MLLLKQNLPTTSDVRLQLHWVYEKPKNVMNCAALLLCVDLVLKDYTSKLNYSGRKDTAKLTHTSH